MFTAETVHGKLAALLAIHHFVWKDRSGRLIDITPHDEGGAFLCRWDERTLMFLPDPQAELIFDVAPLPTRFFPIIRNRRTIAQVRDVVQQMNNERLHWLIGAPRD
jgi:hypothetical protein